MSLFGDGRREALLAILVLLLLAIVQHSPGLFFGAHRGIGTDSARNAWREGATNERVLVPAMRQVREALDEGALPTWNPTSRFGEPFVVSGAAIYYPPFWLLLLPGEGLVDCLVFLHAFLACLGMFRFLRSITLSRYVSFLGGGCFGLGWFFVGSSGRLPDLAAAAWLPVVLELTWRTLTNRDRRRWAPWLGIAIAISFATGGYASASLGTGVAVGMFFWGLWSVDFEARASALKLGGEAIALAVLCAAPLWLDALQLTGDIRSGEPARRLQIEGLAGAIAPSAFQTLKHDSPDQLAMINPGADAVELLLYPGALILFAGLLGLFRPKRTLRGLFWLFTVAYGLLLTLDSPLSSWVFDPIGVAASTPGAGLLLVHLGGVVLACVALESFLDYPAARRFGVPLTSMVFGTAGVLALTAAWLLPHQLLLPVIGALQRDGDILAGEAAETILRHLSLHLLPFAVGATLLALSFPTWRRLGILRFKWLIGTVAMAEIVLVGLWLTPRIDRSNDEMVSKQVASRIRVAALGEWAPRAIWAGHGDMPSPADVAARGIAVVNTDAPAVLDRTATFLETVDPAMIRNGRVPRVGRLALTQLADDPRLALADVDVTVARGPIYARSFAAPPAAPGGAARPARAAGVQIAPRTDPEVGRARLAYDIVFADAAEDAIRAVRAAGKTESTKQLVVEGDLPAGFQVRRPSTPATVKLRSRRSDRLELEVDMGDGSGALFIADAWSPGWRARVDGEPAPILPAQIAFRAVLLDEGRHVVVFEHAPWSERFGLPLAVLGFLLAGSRAVLNTLLRS